MMNKYVGPPYCRAKNVRWPRRMLRLGDQGEYADGRDRQTDGRQKYILMDVRKAKFIWR